MDMTPSRIVIAALLIVLAVAAWDCRSIRQERDAALEKAGVYKTASEGNLATVDALRALEKKVDGIAETMELTREKNAEERAEKRGAVKAVTASDPDFAAWYAAPLPRAIRDGRLRGKTGNSHGNGTRAVDAAALPAAGRAGTGLF